MAKLKYNATLVQNTIDELGAASNQLVNTEDEMRSALTIIANAQGIHHVHTDTLFNTLGFPTACQDMIEDTVTQLKSRAAEIEEYNKEYENASFLEKLGSTAGLFLTKICEGFASAGEQIVDGFASIIGLGAGLISKDAQNSIGNFIKKDHVGDFFGNLYDTSLKGMVIKSWASEKGLACNIFKGVGTGLGYAAALAVTGGIAGGVSTGTVVGAKACAATLMSSLPAAATVAGIAGIGAGTQAGLKGGWDYGDAFCYGIKYGAIQAGTTVAFSLAFKALSKGWQILKTKMKGTANSTALTVIDDAAGAGGTTGGTNPSNPTGSTGGPTGNAGGATGGTTGATGTPGATGTAAKAGMFKQSYTAQNGKAYTCLDDVWDDVVGGNLSKSQLRDVIKNTVGLDDSGVGHAFMADALNVMKGNPPSAVGWRTMATSMDDTVSAAAGTGSGTTINPNGPTTTTTTTTGGVADEMFNSASSSTSGPGTQLSTELVESATTSNPGTQLSTTLDDTLGAGLDDTVGAGLDDTLAASLDDTVGATTTGGQTYTKADLSKVKSSMDQMGERLMQRHDALTSAQSALDDAIANGADDATVTSLRQAVDKAQTAYTRQYDSLVAKQQQYVDMTSSGQFNKIGTEGTHKLIIGDDVIAGDGSVAGNVTTMRAGTTTANGTVEYRPNWTNATAKAEGQINAREFAKLLDDQYGPVAPTPIPTAPSTALATIGPTGLATIAPKGPTGLATIAPQGPTAIATIGPTGLATIAPQGPTGLATIAPKGPTAIATIAPTVTPGPIVTIAPTVVPSIVPTITIAPTIAPAVIPAKGDTIIFGVVQPEEITPTVTITPVPVPTITTAPPIIITTTPVITTPPPVIITTTPPIITTAPPIITTAPPVITTAPPVVTTPPPVVITTPPPVAVTTTPPVVTTTPPIDQEYVPIPNTGIGSPSSPRFGSAPLIAGAVAGVAGVVGGSLLSKRNQKYYDEDEERERKHKKEESEE
ncbi:MAG: hypothetical protein IJE53_01145 [Bacilli bacterium]|nr:hypothetical protein [Bacilli bacterium]